MLAISKKDYDINEEIPLPTINKNLFKCNKIIEINNNKPINAVSFILDFLIKRKQTL